MYKKFDPGQYSKRIYFKNKFYKITVQKIATCKKAYCRRDEPFAFIKYYEKKINGQYQLIHGLRYDSNL